MEDIEYENHENRLMSSLQQMMNSEHFADVVICCADGYKLKAHKVVLSYCSSYLQNIFLGHPGTGDHVTVILQDIVHEDVERVLEFVYTGAAVVPGHRMDGFVTAAGALGIGPLLDPRRHLEMSTVRTHPCYPAPAAAAAAAVYEPSRTAVHQRPSCRAHRQPPRTTGILTPSPWAQNSRPPCAAPKYSAPRTVQDSAPMAAAEPTSITTVVKVMEIQSEPHPTAPTPPEEPINSAIPLTLSPDSDRDIVDQKSIIVSSDANNNGLPERDRNSNQVKSHVCQECGKTFVTKASLKPAAKFLGGRTHQLTKVTTGYCNVFCSMLSNGDTTFPTPLTRAHGIVTPVTNKGSLAGRSRLLGFLI